MVSYCFPPEGFLWQVGLQTPGSLHSEDSLQPMTGRRWGINTQFSHSLLQPRLQRALQSLWRDPRGQSPRDLPENLLIKDFVDWVRPPPSCPIPEEALYEPPCLQELPTLSYTALELALPLPAFSALSYLPPKGVFCLPFLLPHSSTGPSAA